MITYDTEVLTPYGLIEAWKLFPGDELLDSDSKPYKIEDVKESTGKGYLVTLDDESEFVISEKYLNHFSIEIDKDLIINKPISLVNLEAERPDFDPVIPLDGLEFGNFGKYLSIPFYYTMNNIENRKTFFQGLLFSHLLQAHNDINEVVLLVGNNEFAHDILYLVRSLGGTGYYHMFYTEGYYYELTLRLPEYFGEGTPYRKVIKIEELEEEQDFLDFETKQNEYVISDFILLKEENKE